MRNLGTIRKGLKVSHRQLLNGDVVKVVEAKKDLSLTLTSKALAFTKKSPQACAIANQGKIDRGHYFEVYRTVAFEQISPTKCLRYFVPDWTARVLMLNDIGLGAVQKLVGYTLKLKAPTECHTMSFHRSNVRKTRDSRSNAASAKRTVKRPYQRSMGQLLDVRGRAMP